MGSCLPGYDEAMEVLEYYGYSTISLTSGELETRSILTIHRYAVKK